MSQDEAQTARVAQLTEAQRRCVRLIATGSSKHIAQRIGISHRTVDQHIGAAMQRLGVSDRYAARALVAAWDARHPEDLPRNRPPLHAAKSSAFWRRPMQSGWASVRMAKFARFPSSMPRTLKPLHLARSQSRSACAMMLRFFRPPRRSWD
ncbi:helix-turn-helix domain-containing protein [Sphingomonas sp. 7/4-4]|uniref:helix-turn-helix domain-containing protein n=1 Tax=Sphingomonas sp. 7/4-4 TaxID=3018446 RepID=UPI003FA73BDE